MRSVRFSALSGVPPVEPGMDLATVVIEALAANGASLDDGDVLVLAQKIVSKAEDCYLDLRTVRPSAEAERLAAICLKDPRLVQAILLESQHVVRCVPNVLIVRHRLGLVLANAGIDQSNLPAAMDGDRVLLLPQDPDGTAEKLQRLISERTSRRIAVMIIDSLGRAWRLGTCGTVIGAAGVTTVNDMRGQRDLHGRVLQSTILGCGDELAAGASLVMGQAAEGTPIVLVQGAGWISGAGRAVDLIRPAKEDLFP